MWAKHSHTDSEYVSIVRGEQSIFILVATKNSMKAHYKAGFYKHYIHNILIKSVND